MRTTTLTLAALFCVGTFASTCVGLDNKANTAPSKPAMVEPRGTDNSHFPYFPAHFPPNEEPAPQPAIDLSLVSTELWHHYTSTFRSASFSNVAWNNRPEIAGGGAEATVYLPGDDVLVSLSVGGYNNSRHTNLISAGALQAKEILDSRAFWVNAGARYQANDWLYFRGLLGLFAYQINTRVETNAPDYFYQGLTGSRVIPAIGVGGGLQTPGDVPAHLFVGAKIWLPLTNGSFYQTFMGQLEGGLRVRF